MRVLVFRKKKWAFGDFRVNPYYSKDITAHFTENGVFVVWAFGEFGLLVQNGRILVTPKVLILLMFWHKITKCPKAH